MTSTQEPGASGHPAQPAGPKPTDDTRPTDDPNPGGLGEPDTSLADPGASEEPAGLPATEAGGEQRLPETQQPADLPPAPAQFGAAAPPVEPPPPGYGPGIQAPQAPVAWGPVPPVAPPQYGQHSYPQGPGHPGAQYPPSAQLFPPHQQKPIPQKVRWAFFLLLTAAAAWILECVVTVAYVRSTEGRLYLATQTNTSFTPDVLNAVTGLVIATFAIGLALYIWLAFKVRAGRNWARMTVTMLAGLSLMGLNTGSPISMLRVLLGVVAVVLLWLAENRDYFKPPTPAWDARRFPS